MSMPGTPIWCASYNGSVTRRLCNLLWRPGARRCGLLIAVRTLEVQADYERYADAPLASSLTLPPGMVRLRHSAVLRRQFESVQIATKALMPAFIHLVVGRA